MNKEEINNLIENWQKRNISAFYCQKKEEVPQKILELIPPGATIGMSGSVTLGQVGIVKFLEKRGNAVFNQYKPGITRDESLQIRRKGTEADFYLASANAIAAGGELVFFSGYGNRTAGISYAKNLILVCGINKITPNLEAAIKRAREYATPLNCKRLKSWNTPCLADGACHSQICFSPEYKRMCAQILIIESEVIPERVKIILVGEELGF